MERKSRKRGCLIAVLAALVLFVGGCGALVFVGFKATAGAEKRGREFVEKSVAGDVDGAYAMTTEEFRANSTREDLAGVIQPLQQLFAGGSIKNTGRFVRSASGSGTLSAVTYRLSKDDRTGYVRVVLRKEGDDWNVMNVRSSETPLPAEIE